MREKTPTLVALWLSATVTFMGIALFAAPSSPVFVDANPRSRHWTTLYTNTVVLRWCWSPDAERAKLEIAGMNHVFVTNIMTRAVSNVVWQPFGTGFPQAEDVCDLTLTFYGADDAVVETLAARLAIVSGAFGETVVNADADSPGWSKVKENAVIPFDAQWAPASATGAVSTVFSIAKTGGPSETNMLPGVAGYAGWKIRGSGWGFGQFDLSLAFPGTTNTWSARLMRLRDGSVFGLW